MTTLKTETFEVTGIQFIDNTDYDAEPENLKFAANVLINDQFYILVHGDSDYSSEVEILPDDVCVNKELQRKAYNYIEPFDVERIIIAAGFENNFHYLKEHGTL